MIVLNIENPELENKLMKFIENENKKLEDIMVEAIKQFIGSNEKIMKHTKLKYPKKDILKHIHILKTDYDERDLEEVKPYSHVENSAKFVRKLRHKRSYK